MTQLHVRRPLRPGTIAVRRFGERWAAFTTTPLRGWNQVEPGLYMNQMLFPAMRTLPNTHRMALNHAREHRSELTLTAHLNPEMERVLVRSILGSAVVTRPKQPAEPCS